MNNDTIKAAEEYAYKEGFNLNNYHAFIAGAEYMQAQKDEQIKELVEALECIDSLYGDRKDYIPPYKEAWEQVKELIQKHKG